MGQNLLPGVDHDEMRRLLSKTLEYNANYYRIHEPEGVKNCNELQEETKEEDQFAMLD